jgi:hypothetical protein
MGLILFFRLIKMIGANNFKMFGACTKKKDWAKKYDK